MSDIAPISMSGAANSVSHTSPIHVDGPRVSSVNQAGDRVELTSHARFMDMMRHMPGVRAELVDHIRAEIEAGTYDNQQRMTVAIDRMMQELHV